MKDFFKRIISRPGILLLVIAVVPLLAGACTDAAGSEIIESLLNNVDNVNGTVTVETEDGRKVTFKVVTDESDQPEKTDLESCQEKDSECSFDGQHMTITATVVETGQDIVTLKCNQDYVFDIRVTDDTVITSTDNSPLSLDELEEGMEVVVNCDLTALLPSLNSIEDVFRVLGNLEQAMQWHEEGLSWGHIAEEFGYTFEKMKGKLIAIAQENVYAAKHAGCLPYEEAMALLDDFKRLAREWAEEIFEDIETPDCEDVENLLPQLESKEDVFIVIGKWEEAKALREEGLSWADVTAELGYTYEKLKISLLEVAEENVYAAKHAGCLTPEQAKEMLNSFIPVAKDWAEEIIASTGD